MIGLILHLNGTMCYPYSHLKVTVTLGLRSIQFVYFILHRLRAFLMEKMFRKVGVPLPKVTLDMLERVCIFHITSYHKMRNVGKCSRSDTHGSSDL